MNTETFHPSPTKYPEVVIGIVSPVGTNIENVIASINKHFSEKNYSLHHVKISNSFPSIANILSYKKLDQSNRYKRISTYIDFGDFLREKMGENFLAYYAISEIAERRPKGDKENPNAQQQVYIIDQLKTEAELSLLRDIYGSAFIQMSIYSARDVRVDYLARTMARDDSKRDRNAYRGKAEELVVIDEDELDKPHGQKVGKIFQLADVVINADRTEGRDDTDQQVRRFVELLFGHNAYSPNRLEYGMYVAHSAALRSLDLSRQVGAAIFRDSGEIASLGANEVPKAGGGTYWCDDPFDAREYKLRADSNDTRKAELLNEVLEIVLGKEHTLETKVKDLLNQSQFMDALEYGRIVHAEMSAISDAARLGIKIGGGTIYCTTFPCHMCAKHIVSSGLSKVVFLEPYPKSLTSDMHSDAVKIEGTSRGGYEKFPKVDFVPFYGITPTRYREFFQRFKRKKNTVFQDYRAGEAKPMFSAMLPWHLAREADMIIALKDRIENAVSSLTNSSLAGKQGATEIGQSVAK